mgnify:CR=1 FL=1
MSKVLTKVFLSSVLILLIVSNCKTKGVVTNNNNSTQNTEETIIVGKDIVGKIAKVDLEYGEHAKWFNKEISTYKVDTETLSDFENNPERIKALSVKIFMGTWCEDSQREVPRFINILSFLGVTNYEIIGLNTNKQSPQGYENGMNINYVPTFIIYQNGKEVNRIIESPVVTLEKDLVAILQAKKYTPNYQ